MFEVFKNAFKKSPKEELTLCVCTVTSYAVTAAVVRVYRREGAVHTPVVLFSCEEKISIRQARDPEILEESIAEHARKCLEKCRSFHGVFDEVVYTLGEPWVTTIPRAVHVEKMKPFKVTKSTISDVVSRDTKVFESEIEQMILPEELGIVEISKPEISINGYHTSEMIGVLVKTLDVQFTISYASAQLMEELVLAFADVFHHTTVSFAALNVAQPLLLNEQVKASMVFLGGTSSTLSTIDQRSVTHAITVSGGLFGFEEYLMQEFDVHQRQVASVMKFADDEKFLKHHRDLYYQRIQAATENLGDALHRGFLHIKKQTQAIPGPVYFIGNPAWISMIEPFLQANTGLKFIAPPLSVLDGAITYTHQAKVQHLPLSLAIIQAVDKVK